MNEFSLGTRFAQCLGSFGVDSRHSDQKKGALPAMNANTVRQFRSLLLKMRERVGGEVNHVVQSLHEEVHVNENISSAPVHLADVALGAVDADVEVLQAERKILEQITTALNRIESGTFGKCEHCGAAISEERLKALPYAAHCVQCARENARFGDPHM